MYPFETVGLRKGRNEGREKKQTAILTDSPIKSALKTKQDILNSNKRKIGPLNINKNKTTIPFDNYLLIKKQE